MSAAISFYRMSFILTVTLEFRDRLSCPLGYTESCCLYFFRCDWCKWDIFVSSETLHLSDQNVFHFPVCWLTLFLFTELWNVFRGGGSWYSGTISENGMRRSKCKFSILTPATFPPSRPSLWPKEALLSTLPAPLAASTHLQCHNKECQISRIQLIKKTHIPPYCVIRL